MHAVHTVYTVISTYLMYIKLPGREIMFDFNKTKSLMPH